MNKHTNSYNRFKTSIKDLARWVDIDDQKYIEKYRQVTLQLEQVEKERKSILEREEHLLKEMYNMKLQPLRDIKLDIPEFLKHKPNKRQVLDMLFTEGFIDTNTMEYVLDDLWNNRGVKTYQYNNPYEERG